MFNFTIKKAEGLEDLEKNETEKLPDNAVMLKEGDRVEEGQLVCKIEAMKMELDFNSTETGTVKQVCVKPGDMVETDQPLIIVE